MTEASGNFPVVGMADPVRPGLDEIIFTELLHRRPSRAADHAGENRALVALARALAESPETILQELVDAALGLTGGGSAGISVLERHGDKDVFRWRATAGQFFPFAQGTLPRDFSPCGVVVDRNATQLMVDPARFYPYIADLQPHVAEVLLVPFEQGGAPVGTLWVVAHAGSKRFDGEDVRLVTSLSKFASAAVRVVSLVDARETENRLLVAEVAERGRAEAAARESDARFGLMADAVPQIIWVTDADGRVLFFNQQWSKYTGVPYEPTTAAEVASGFVHPDDGAATTAAFDEARRTGSTFLFEHRIRSAAGEYRWFVARGEPYRDPRTGDITRWFGASIDIDDRKRAEARDRFLIALDDAARPLTDAAEITATYARLLGEHLGSDRCAYADVEADEDTFNLTGDYNRPGVPSIVGRYRFADFGQEVLRLMRADEPYVVADVDAHQPPVGNVSAYRATIIRAVVCVPLHKGGRFVAAMAVHQKGPRGWTADEVALVRHVAGRCWESIERSRVERTLRASEARLRQLADAMPQMVWVTRPDGYHEYYNRRWYEFTGVPEGSTDGDGWNELFHPEDRERAWATWRHSLATGELYEIEYRLRHHSGAYRWTLGRAMPVRDERGEIERWFGTCTDIDALKRLMDERETLLGRERSARAEAESANQAKDRFLAVLSHELRTPLTPVAMAATAMEMDARLPFECRDDAAMIRRNIDLETRLIDDLLDLSRVTSGKLRLNVQPTEVHRLIHHVLETVGPELHEKQLTVERHLTAVDDRVEADPARLQQTLWNLLKNSAKFTPAGGRVFIQTRNEVNQLVIAVGDTGKGIAAETLPHIFDPFEQGAADVTQRYGGMGLGLAIAKAVVDLHGGSISANSDGEGKGAVFTVALPLTATRAPAAPTLPAQPVEAAKRPIRVLLVEDHADTAKILVRLLRTDGSDVRWAGSMAAALELAVTEPFDVVVSDLGLPDGSGHDLMRRLLRDRPMLGIAMSGYGMEDDIRQSREAGFVEHLVKPVSLPQLREAIRRVANTRGNAAPRAGSLDARRS